MVTNSSGFSIQNRLKSYYNGLLGFNVTISSVNLGRLNLYFFDKIEKNYSPTTFNLSVLEKIDQIARKYTRVSIEIFFNANI